MTESVVKFVFQTDFAGMVRPVFFNTYLFTLDLLEICRKTYLFT